MSEVKLVLNAEHQRAFYKYIFSPHIIIQSHNWVRCSVKTRKSLPACLHCSTFFYREGLSESFERTQLAIIIIILEKLVAWNHVKYL